MFEKKMLFNFCNHFRSGSKVFDRSNSSKACVASEASSISLNPEPSLVITNEDNEETFLTDTKLSATATLTELFEAFRHPVTGVCFLAKIPSLPSYTFVSYDAINWLNNHIEGGCNAIEILERMRRYSITHMHFICFEMFNEFSFNSRTGKG